ncbi:MAG: FAD-dependent oxidoreductase [Gammaproteobacteria bacterium]
MHSIVIIGTGLAGYTTARELRKLDKDTPLTLVSADDGCFYSKPMLSNAFAQGKTAEQLATQDVAQMQVQLNATILAHTRVNSIDTARHTVTCDGKTLPYSKLVLALGADPIRAPLAGDAADQVLTVNDLADYARLRKALEGAKRIVIIGAGLIGCEFANDLCTAGFSVHVVDPNPAPLNRLLPEAAGAQLRAALGRTGAEWHANTKAVSVNRAHNGYRVTLADGAALEADVVLSAIGLKPRVLLAQQAGIKINRGIVTDRYLQTSAPDVYALGDCAEVEGLVLPFVMPIMHAARALARTLAGTPAPVVYPAMPVVVKTPAYPIVVSPPPAGVSGAWQVTEGEEGVRALFYDTQQHLHGFALTGKSTSEKAALTQQLPPLLG